MPQPPPGEPNPYAPPTASLEHDVRSVPGPVVFRSLWPFAQAITVLLVTRVVVRIVETVHLGDAIGAAHRLLDGVGSASVEVDSLVRRLAVIRMIGGALGIGLLVLFCMFVFRANKNVRALHVIEPQFTPGRAVSAFFIPIWNLYKPYQAMREIWHGSNPDPDAVVVASSLRGPPLLKWWWGLYLASFLQVKSLTRTTEAAAFILWAKMALIGRVLEMAAALLAIALVRAVAARQDARRRLHPAPLT